ncbi:hypothetical protein ACB092_02G105900 [Castanea dentata]
MAKQFKCYVINDVKFRTKDSEATRKTQKSGVCVVIEGNDAYGPQPQGQLALPLEGVELEEIALAEVDVARLK